VHAGVPKDPSPSEQWELKMVGALAGRSFRHWYASLEVYDHRQDIEEATSEAQDGSSPAVRKEARAELPMLRKHLKLAQRALTANP
jgi:putative membrane protein